jgi:hypothetical protein
MTIFAQFLKSIRLPSPLFGEFDEESLKVNKKLSGLCEGRWIQNINRFHNLTYEDDLSFSRFKVMISAANQNCTSVAVACDSDD